MLHSVPHVPCCIDVCVDVWSRAFIRVYVYVWIWFSYPLRASPSSPLLDAMWQQEWHHSIEWAQNYWIIINYFASTAPCVWLWHYEYSLGRECVDHFPCEQDSEKWNRVWFFYSHEVEVNKLDLEAVGVDVAQLNRFGVGVGVGVVCRLSFHLSLHWCKNGWRRRWQYFFRNVCLNSSTYKFSHKIVIAPNKEHFKFDVGFIAGAYFKLQL